MRTAIGIVALALLVAACAPEPDAGLANPASVFCEDRGGTVSIETAADGSQTGYCVLPDGTRCEEWAYYDGTCP